MQRRKFLGLTAIGATAIAIPAIGFGAVSTKSAITGIIQKELSYLNLDKQGIEQYAADYLQYEGNVPRIELKLKMYRLLGVNSEKSSIVSALIEKYLLSTDFFLKNMDESRKINYIGYYNPYNSPCANPFSAQFYPEAHT
ncbi:hypothetical protein Q0590_07080 [Rhodocytophaga aerolata]|uniref:Twin-arginine translocation signal domain-containing protein n=1 Tax=Rhodocytophaga aerolata TaxID=455078 RepID=A0ABT8R460_9BACT|nr:hypothetical protein [Rhodocytophaga aerolata]MDO1446008.1 hypothetical protein [Rhodocytophaga aerolata]